MTNQMIEVKTAELEGVALDWAVAEAIGWKEPVYGVGAINIDGDFMSMTLPDPVECIENPEPRHFDHYEQWMPSKIWSQAGPLIDKFRVELTWDGETRFRETGYWGYAHGKVSGASEGDTALIAACRALVAAKLGYTVTVPRDLLP